MEYTSDSEEFKKKKSLLIRRNKGKDLLTEYQNELEWLFPNCENKCSILDLEASDAIVETVRTLATSVRYKQQKVYMDFNDKELLGKIIDQLYHSYSGQVYFAGKYAEYCGIVLLSSLSCFNSDFSCTFKYSEMFSFWSFDLKNFLLVDFGEEDGGLYIELKIEGERWSKEIVSYE